MSLQVMSPILSVVNIVIIGIVITSIVMMAFWIYHQKYAGVFLPGKPFQPNLMFGTKTRPYPNLPHPSQNL